MPQRQFFSPNTISREVNRAFGNWQNSRQVPWLREQVPQTWHPPPAPYNPTASYIPPPAPYNPPAGQSYIPPPAPLKHRYDQRPSINQDQTLPSLGKYPIPEKIPQKHLSFTENPEIEGEPSNFQEGPESKELPEYLL